MGGVASEAGLARIILPHYEMRDLEALIQWEHQEARRDDGAFEQVSQLCRDYFNAKTPDFSAVACDLPGGFAGVVLKACREIPYGQTLSYSQLAMTIGREDAARAVAAALGKNPIPLVVPCHRVTYADGKLGGFSAEGGVEFKRRMLDLERSGR
jgi:methylated-DNA-[protein]-cysteine S-methyltransferase